MQLTGDRVELREFTVADLGAVAAIVGDDRVTRWLSFDSRTRDEADTMLQGILTRAQQTPRMEYYFAISPRHDESQVVGFVRLGLAGIQAAKLSRRSFSGDHPYRPACLAEMLDEDEILDYFGMAVPERVAQISEFIDAGTCPRCLGPLPTSDSWLPAGSHATECRCIPVCGTCGTHESLTGAINPNSWPVDQDVITAYVAQVLAQAEPAILDTDTGTLISEDGAIGHVNLPEDPQGS